MKQRPLRVAMCENTFQVSNFATGHMPKGGKQPAEPRKLLTMDVLHGLAFSLSHVFVYNPNAILCRSPVCNCIKYDSGLMLVLMITFTKTCVMIVFMSEGNLAKLFRYRRYKVKTILADSVTRKALDTRTVVQICIFVI